MKNQIMFVEVANIPKQNVITGYQKQKWKDKFQAYCDKEANKSDCSPWCKCGYMDYCDYCRGMANGNPCAMAVIEMCARNKKEIDYTNLDFEKFLEEL